MQTDWQNYYHTHLQARLQQTVTYIQQQPIAEVAAHFESFVALLHEARRYNDLHPMVAEVIIQLHPRPILWTYRDVWADELLFATTTLRHTSQIPQRLQLLADLTEVLADMEQYPAALEIGQSAHQLARTRHALVSQAHLSTTLLLVYDETNQPDLAQALRQDLLATLQHPPMDVPATDLQHAWAWFKYQDILYPTRLLNLAQGIAIASDIINTLEALDVVAPPLLPNAYRNRSLLYRRQGNYRQAVCDIQREVQLRIAAGDLDADARSAGNLGLIYWSMAALNQAEVAFRKRIAWCEQANDRVYLMRSVGNLGLVYLSKGERQTALRYVKRHLELAQQLNAQREIARAQLNWGNVALSLGDYATAEPAIADWVAQQAEFNDQVAVESLNLSRCYAARGARLEAESLVQQTLQWARVNHAAVLQGLALRHLADYQPHAARQAMLQQVLAITREQQRQLEEAECLLALAALAKTVEEQQKLWAQGTQHFIRIGAGAWLDGISLHSLPCIPATGL